jgi:hypothetical protein
MKFLRDLFTCNWQTLVALACAVVAFFASQHLLPLIDPSAGTNDTGILHILFFGLVGTLFAIAVSAGSLPLAFPTIDQWLDRGGFAKAWESLMPEQKVRYTFVAIGILIFTFAFFTNLAAG